jgi:hypothetical protein
VLLEKRCEPGNADVAEAVGGRFGMAVGPGEGLEPIVLAAGDEGEVGGEVRPVELLRNGRVDSLLLFPAVALRNTPDGIDPLVPVGCLDNGFDGL